MEKSVKYMRILLKKDGRATSQEIASEMNANIRQARSMLFFLKTRIPLKYEIEFKRYDRGDGVMCVHKVAYWHIPEDKKAKVAKKVEKLCLEKGY